MSEYLLALGYGGDREAAAWFEWNFRCKIGEEKKSDNASRDAFLREFIAGTENGQEYAIVAEDPKAPFVRAFAEFGKAALKEHRDLFVFYILEDAQNPSNRFKLYLKADDPEAELPEHQIYCDGFDVPRAALMWMQEQVGCRFYVTEDRSEMMIEFPYQGPEELPVLQ
ncbi:hypothetical protein JJB07_21680 [Tumebacillus sp. ITR2]|uniref:Uncharacterized protein n=1 Tax=Tumebacillus amylolyticus TaxID=2801339 RepID=A0ABS1JG04_9BACL|nr:hypothetical protein [Tumebacillus amylolyticus]MBL0389207.1 hypothetical protein [Tumebacillus amylolyticus]